VPAANAPSSRVRLLRRPFAAVNSGAFRPELRFLPICFSFWHDPHIGACNPFCASWLCQFVSANAD
jgi:hypothetical protein